MKIKILHDSAFAQSHPWVNHKEEWEATHTTLGYTITDKEAPSWVVASGTVVPYYDVYPVNDLRSDFESHAHTGVAIGNGLTVGTSGVLGFNTSTGLVSMTNALVPITVGYNTTAPVITEYGFTSQAPAKERLMSDMEFEDILIPLGGSNPTGVREFDTTRLVQIDPESEFGSQFKGLAQALNGLHLRFRSTTQKLDCKEYRDQLCMVLVSESKMDLHDVYRGPHVLHLKGIMIPSLFLR